MTIYIESAFLERELMEYEISVLVEELLTEEIGKVMEAGMRIRLHMLRRNIDEIDRLIAERLSQLNINIVLHQVNHNLSSHDN